MNRVILIYTAVVATGLLVSSVRSSMAPDPTNKLGYDIAQIKESVDKLNAKQATAEGSLTQEVNFLKAQIAGSQQDPATQTNSGGAPLENVLGQSVVAGKVKVAPDFGITDVYNDTSFSSPVVGKMDPEKIYTYTKKQNNWVLIRLDEEKEGWVNSKLVTETQASP